MYRCAWIEHALVAGLMIGLPLGTGVVAQPTGDAVMTEAAEADTAWITFLSEESRFSVAMPSEPAAYTLASETNTEDSRVYMQMQLAEADRLEIYAVALVESADSMEPERDRFQTLLSCVSGLGNSAPISSTQTEALNGYQGIEAEFQTADGGLQISRCYISEGYLEANGDDDVPFRAYMLTVNSEPFSAGPGLQPVGSDEVALSEVALSEGVRSPTIDTFFSSFQILD